MWLVDSNVLLYAVDRRSPHHAASRAWLQRSLAGPESVGIAWSSVHAFLRLSTSASMFTTPLSAEEACRQIRSWLDAPAALLVEPSARHADVLCGLLDATGTAGNLVADAHLAAIATEHAATIVTFDADFLRFPGVRSQRPTG
ncbi:MAG: TA system VapC family ribonuclease toxin [Chloroflexota bacterium]